MKIEFIARRNIKFALFIICLLINSPMWSQVREVKNAPSPEVANLGTFGSVPVGHYTGTPDISVPFYTMKVGKLSIPIQARYHLANVKPHTPPSSLGIGWTLCAGGYIARTVIGVQDEKETYTTRAGFYFNHNKIDAIENATSKSQMLKNYTHLSGNDFYELSADEFIFNFNGYSGTFFMDKDGQWRVISDDDIKVEFNEKDGFITCDSLSKRFRKAKNFKLNKRFFNKFTLVTPDGTRYEFGGNNATEYSVPYYNQNPKNGDLIATCWRLSKITTIDKRVVCFEYAADSYMCDIHFSPQFIILNNDGEKMAQKNFGRTGYTGFLTMPSRLTKISSNEESIMLNYDRDYSYGKLFESAPECLFWENDEMAFDDNNIRYMYGGYDNNYYDNVADRFLYYIDVRYERNKEREIREAIAKKITHDYLASIEINRRDNENIIIDFSYDSFQMRKLLSKIRFISEGIPILSEKAGLTDSVGVDVVKPIAHENPLKTFSKGTIGNYPAHDFQEQNRCIIKEYEYKFEYYLGNNANDLWSHKGPLVYTDSWGYFSVYGDNGSINNVWKLTSSYSFSDFKIREPSLFSAEKFALKTITYPTGGRNCFIYELNNFSKVFDLRTNSLKDSLGTSGGLRVKRVMTYDVSDSLLYSKYYVYQTITGERSGILKGTPCYYDRIYFNDGKDYYLDYYTFEDINPYALNFNAPSVGYSSVFEYLYDGNGNLLARTNYQYSNYDTDINGKSHMDMSADYTANVYGYYASAAFTSMAFERGKLTSKMVLNRNNEVLENCMYDYTRTKGEPYSTVLQAWHYNDLIGDIFCYSYLYKTYTNKYLLSVEKRQEKMDNGIQNTETRYEYETLGLPIAKTVITNSGEMRKTEYVYSVEWYDKYPWIKEKNVIIPINVSVSPEEGQYNWVENILDTTSIGVPYISKQNSMWILNIPNFVYTYHTDYTIEKTDKYGNPVVLDEEGVKTVMLWSHNGQKLIVSIKNATYDEVRNVLKTNPEDISDLQVGTSIFNLLRTKLCHAIIYTYEYDKRLNLIRKTAPNGFANVYNYDPFNRLRSEFRVINGRTELVNSYKYNYSTRQ